MEQEKHYRHELKYAIPYADYRKTPRRKHSGATGRVNPLDRRRTARKHGCADRRVTDRRFRNGTVQYGRLRRPKQQNECRQRSGRRKGGVCRSVGYGVHVGSEPDADGGCTGKRNVLRRHAVRRRTPAAAVVCRYAGTVRKSDQTPKPHPVRRLLGPTPRGAAAGEAVETQEIRDAGLLNRKTRGCRIEMKTPFSSPDRRIQIRQGRKNGEKRIEIYNRLFMFSYKKSAFPPNLSG